ncbi:PREDICTED: protein YLS9-like [Fragaria vesca subsp. vesca]|uniref:protein YLS9-like n=1 Tax=Fragaria vesca subsp. vesca TaxID=101020 RepID=UPI0002C34CC7|nr:PREDICTED: protein YLS9-like [Fragaria vesca subsp. vesca]
MADPSRPVTSYPAPPYAQPYPQPAAAANGHPNGAYPNYPVYQQASYNAYTARAAFVRRFVIAMVFLFVIFGSLLLIIWLILRPKIPDFRVDSFTVTNLNVSSSRQALTGTWSVGFDVFNPNKKMTIEYDGIGASVFYRSGFISETRVPPFQQGKRVRSAVNATLSAANSFVDDRVASGINADRAARGLVSFNIKLLARVQFRKGGWRLRRRLLRVLCLDVPVAISNNGTGKMTGGGRDCGVAV